MTTHIHQPHVVLGDDEWSTAASEIETSGGGLAVEHGRVAHRVATLLAETVQTHVTTKD